MCTRRELEGIRLPYEVQKKVSSLRKIYKIFKISLSIITESLLELLSVLSGEFAIIVSHAPNNVDLSPTVRLIALIFDL